MTESKQGGKVEYELRIALYSGHNSWLNDWKLYEMCSNKQTIRKSIATHEELNSNQCRFNVKIKIENFHVNNLLLWNITCLNFTDLWNS